MSHPNALRPATPVYSPEPSRGTLGLIAYEFAPQSDLLPSFDPTRTFKRLLLSPPQIRAYNAFMYRTRVWTTVSFNVGALLSVGLLVLPQPIGRRWAFLPLLLQITGLTSITMPSHWELHLLAMRAYDFWFFLLNNVIFLITFGVLLGDHRILALLPNFIIHYAATVIDAMVTDSSHVNVGSIISTLTMIVLFFLVAFRFIDESQHVVLAHYSQGRHAISTRDVLLNVIVTMAILLVRGSYARWSTSRATVTTSSGNCAFKSTSRRICNNFQCGIRLRATMLNHRCVQVKPSVSDQPHAQDNVHINAQVLQSRVQLRFQPVTETFDASQTIANSVMTFRCFMRMTPAATDALSTSNGGLASVSRGRHIVVVGSLTALYITGIVGFALTTLCSISYSSYTFLQQLQHPVFPITAVFLTSTFCITFGLLCQRRLLYRLCTSFDFVFSSLQFTSAQLCIGDFFEWDMRHVLGWSSWTWMHWLLTLDALTPVVRKRLGFRLMYATPVVLACLATQVFFAVELFYWDSWVVHDRLLFRGTIRGRAVEIHTMPFFLSRLVAIFVWCCRILWRIARRTDEADCIMLLGTVEFTIDRPSTTTRTMPVGATDDVDTASQGIVGKSSPQVRREWLSLLCGFVSGPWGRKIAPLAGDSTMATGPR